MPSEAAEPGAATAPAERLVLKTDHPERFSNGSARAAEELAPRLRGGARETHRSVWSYTQPDDCPLATLVAADPAAASRLIQALALYVFDVDPTVALRSRVQGICFNRTAVAAIVRDDPGGHICAVFDHTHRHLATGGEGSAEAARLAVASEASALERWRYTREEIVDLLAELLHAGRLRPEHQATAERIVAAAGDGT